MCFIYLWGICTVKQNCAKCNIKPGIITIYLFVNCKEADEWKDTERLGFSYFNQGKF